MVSQLLSLPLSLFLTLVLIVPPSNAASHWFPLRPLRLLLPSLLPLRVVAVLPHLLINSGSRCARPRLPLSIPKNSLRKASSWILARRRFAGVQPRLNSSSSDTELHTSPPLLLMISRPRLRPLVLLQQSSPVPTALLIFNNTMSTLVSNGEEEQETTKLKVLGESSLSRLENRAGRKTEKNQMGLPPPLPILSGPLLLFRVTLLILFPPHFIITTSTH